MAFQINYILLDEADRLEQILSKPTVIYLIEVLSPYMNVSERNTLYIPKHLKITLSLIKFFLQVQPRGWAILVEADVPFALPTDTRQLKNAKKEKRHVIDRKNFLDQMENVLSGVGLNGEACLRKIMCTVSHHRETKRKSLVRDLLYAAFIYPEDSFDFKPGECDVSFAECPEPLLEYLMGNVDLQ